MATQTKNRKYDNAKVVNILEDFKDSNGKVIYLKGSEHAIHKKLLAKLVKRGLKVKDTNFDFAAAEAKAHEVLLKQREKESK